MFCFDLFYPIPPQVLWFWTRSTCLGVLPPAQTSHKPRMWRRPTGMQALVKMFDFCFTYSSVKCRGYQSVVLRPLTLASPKNLIDMRILDTSLKICRIRISRAGAQHFEFQGALQVTLMPMQVFKMLFWCSHFNFEYTLESRGELCKILVLVLPLRFWYDWPGSGLDNESFKSFQVRVMCSQGWILVL